MSFSVSDYSYLHWSKITYIWGMLHNIKTITFIVTGNKRLCKRIIVIPDIVTRGAYENSGLNHAGDIAYKMHSNPVNIMTKDSK